MPSVLQSIRSHLQVNNLTALLLPHRDAHQSEYPPLREYRVKYVSNFSGSAATVIITQDEALLFTDSRYYIQATEELSPEWILMRSSEPNADSPSKWCSKHLPPNSTVGVYSDLISIKEVFDYEKLFSSHNITLFPMTTDIVGDLWDQDEVNMRPTLPSTKIYHRNVTYTGATMSEKIAIVRQELGDHDAMIISSLPETAWVFNLDSLAIPFSTCPAYTYSIITKEKAVLVVPESQRFGSTAEEELRKEGVEVKREGVEKVAEEMRLWKRRVFIPCTTPFSILKPFHDAEESEYDLDQYTVQKSFIIDLKVVKNPVEQENQRTASLKDSVALCEAFCSLHRSVIEGKKRLTEEDFSDFLIEKRQEKHNFISPSFESIVAVNGNAAVVHYRPHKQQPINQGDVILIDSGGFYFEGTTDVTRTFYLGRDKCPNSEIIDNYTRVLMGHIDLFLSKFPVDTLGSQLNIVARRHLYDQCRTFGHGVGHGVGIREVHESGAGISEKNSDKLKEGMILSNEPGYYKENEYGIRTENLMLVKEIFPKWLGFETFTLVPYDFKLLNPDLLSEKQKEWVNNYYDMIMDKIHPLVNEETKSWLKDMCCKL
ncbi:hypothetical protein P9112_014255 [Eukaryota sp. TZLM1-RC]